MSDLATPAGTTPAGAALGWYEQMQTVSRPPEGIAGRLPGMPVPTARQYAAASGLIAAAAMYARRDVDDYEQLASPLGRLAVRYGASLGAEDVADRIWCGTPHLAGHIAAGAVAEDCRRCESTAGDEQLVELVDGLAAALWGGGLVDRPGRSYHNRRSPLDASLALHRHVRLCGYVGGEAPPLEKLGRCGRVSGAQRLAAIFYLCHAAVHRYGSEACRDALPVGLRVVTSG
jgi:hypothetical protein